MAHDRNVIVQCPPADRNAVNAICAELGHTDNELRTPVFTPGGSEPAAYVLSGWATEGFARMLTEWPAMPDNPEPGVNYAPLDEATLAWLRSTLTISINPPLDPEGVSYPTPRAHFNATIAAAGLVEVETGEMS